jgi:hypothetical protein
VANVSSLTDKKRIATYAGALAPHGTLLVALFAGPVALVRALACRPARTWIRSLSIW